MKKKVYIETLGCQMNKSDSERMLGMLEMCGYDEAECPEEAGLLIINTCSIRQLSEDKAFSMLGLWGKWKRQGKNIKIGISGCVAQQKGFKIFKRMPFIDMVLGTHNIYELPNLIKRLENDEKVCAIGEIPFPESGYEIKRKKSVNAWIPITEGCNNFCTYCIVPYTRGRERSREPELILKEVKDALNCGFKEITLLGQNVDSYGKELDGWNLSRLLREINALDGYFWIRFVTSYPTDITDELIQTAVELPKVCEYFHIPMQSGSNVVLKRMNRRYDRETYGKIVDKVRRLVKDVTITSDFIAAFPGETEEQFEETLSAMREFELDYSNTADYSPREKTVAAKWVEEFLPEEVKDKRLAKLNEVNRECCLKSNKKFINRELEVLIEGFENHKGVNVITGRTRNNKIVHIPYDTDLTSEFVRVKITDVMTWYLKGELIK